LGQLARLTQQVQQLPKQPAPWIARGRHLLTGGEHKPALNDFQRAIQLSPDHVEANCGRAATLLAMRQTDDAIGACNVILAKSASAVAASIRADAYFQKGMLDEAINDYAMAKRRDSQVAKAHRMRAEKLRSAGQAAQAEADLAMAAELDPSSNAVRQVSNEVPAPK
jgi:tetratricopeptide (TPR) repeat protein